MSKPMTLNEYRAKHADDGLGVMEMGALCRGFAEALAGCGTFDHRAYPKNLKMRYAYRAGFQDGLEAREADDEGRCELCHEPAENETARVIHGARFCLDCLNERDIIFCPSWPDKCGGCEVDEEAARALFAEIKGRV